MSQLPERLYIRNDEKYSTLDQHLLYDECSEELEVNGIENYTEYIPIYRKNEALKELLDRACEWLKDYQEYPNHDIDTDRLIEAFCRAVTIK